jgi:hypothetical protein
MYPTHFIKMSLYYDEQPLYFNHETLVPVYQQTIKDYNDYYSLPQTNIVRQEEVNLLQTDNIDTVINLNPEQYNIEEELFCGATSTQRIILLSFLLAAIVFGGLVAVVSIVKFR